MKRIWFAVIFMLIASSLCVGEQMYVKKVYNDLNNEISKAEEYNDFDDVLQAIKNIQKYWSDNNDLLFTIADHDVLDDLGTAIRSLDADDEDLKGTLKEIRALNSVFYENQKVTFANIF